MNQSCGQTLGGAGERRHNRDSSQNMIVEREPARGPRYNPRYPGGISIWCECVHTNEYLTCWHFLPDTRCVCGRWSGSSSSRQAPCCSHQRQSVRGEGVVGYSPLYSGGRLNFEILSIFSSILLIFYKTGLWHNVCGNQLKDGNCSTENIKYTATMTKY